MATALVVAAPAWAADEVSVRSGAHDGYTRVVFDWPHGATYHVTPLSPGHLRINFDKPARLDTGGLEMGPGSNVKSVRQLSANGAPLVLQVDIPENSRTSHEGAGGKIILDIYDAGRKAEPVKPETQEKTQPPAVVSLPSANTAAAKAALAALTSPPPVSFPPATQTSAPSAIAPQGGRVESAPDIIALSSTEKTGLAAFTRNGFLWLVADRPNIAVQPQLSGPHEKQLGGLVRMPYQDAAVWRMKVPDDTNVYGDGDGLVWHVKLTGQKQPTHETPVQRVVKDDPSARDGTLVWPLRGVTRILSIPDPSTGDRLQVATVSSGDQYGGAPYRYVDLETLPSIIGLAVAPHVDDLTVQKTDKGVTVSRPSGLALSTDKDVSRNAMQNHAEAGPSAQPKFQSRAELSAPPPATPNIADSTPGPAPAISAVQPFFNIEHWVMGGDAALSHNQTVLLGSMKEKDPAGQAQDLLTLAKMNLANDRGPEALGFLNFVSDTLPSMGDTPEFTALRGASEALSGKYELALEDLSLPALAGFHELDYWRAYTLANLGDWKQAGQAMPADMSLLLKYPQPLLEKMAPKLAEVALRGGNVARAQMVLDALHKNEDSLRPWTKAALDYLQGQADRQQGQFDAAGKLWTPLVSGKDNLYRVRAGLALNAMELEKGKTTLAKATDRLEGLRYGWRGDELESQINFALGKLYLQQRQYLKGFTILRDAAGMNPDSDIAHDITNYMAGAFQDLMMKDVNISAIDAMNIYEQFRELAPPGDDGNKIVQKLAERMASADLLGRAGDLLQNQINYSLQGQERADIAMRLAAISLLNKDPQRALGALDKAEPFYKSQPADAVRDKHLRDAMLLRARALSQQGKTEDALAMLAKMGAAPDVSKLRADIAWQAGLWPDASDALADLIADENLDSGKPFNDYQAGLILNRAVALNLGGDRVELAAMRQSYAVRMNATSRAHLFDVMTRPHAVNLMSEEQTLQSMVGEVDMFKDFLTDYKTATDQGKALNTVK